jgi:hypothetical protein
VTPDKLTVGCVYHMIVYEDEAMTKMSIQSYEYLGPRPGSPEPSYRFKPLSPFPLSDDPNPRESIYDGEVDLTAKNLQHLADLPELIDQLQRIQRNGPGRMWADAS